MKANGFLKAVLTVGVALFGMGLTGCVEFTSPLCTASNLEDIPGLDGHKVLSTLDSDFNLKTHSFDIDHVGKGRYFKGGVQTCKIGSNTVMQMKTKEGTYSIAAINSSSAGFSYSTLIMGAKELEQAGIKYKVVERGSDKVLGAWANAMQVSVDAPNLMTVQSKSKVLVIDNSEPSSQQAIEKYAVPYAIGAIFK